MKLKEFQCLSDDDAVLEIVDSTKIKGGGWWTIVELLFTPTRGCSPNPLPPETGDCVCNTDGCK